MHILVVEDDQATIAILSAVLRREGWDHVIAENRHSAWGHLQERAFDLLLLDLGLPDGDGAEVLRRVRSAAPEGLPEPTMPVLIISGNTRLQSRVSGLDAGADAYITKPFHPDEVAALIRAIRRRTTVSTAGLVRYRDLVLDPEARTLTRAGTPVSLSEAEFHVLLALVEARPRVLSRAEIQGSNRETMGDSNAVEVHVHHLRRKLGQATIRTVRGLGYCVAADPPAPAQ